MDRKKAYKLLEVFGNGYIGETPKGKHIVFARQSKKDIEQIEKIKDDELVDEWKALTYMNHIYGCVSLNEMQRISLLELEMDERKGIGQEELQKWYKETEKKYESEVQENGN